MAKIRGKKLTRVQMNLLNRNGIDDAENWSYIKTETVDPNGNKSPSRNFDKITYLVIQHKDTGEVRKIEM